MNETSRILNSFKEIFGEVFRQLVRLIREGNRRYLIVQQADQRVLLRLPLTVVVIALLLLWRFIPLIFLAAIVALALKVRFVIATGTRPSSP